MEQFEQSFEQQVLGLTCKQAVTKLAQHGEMEPGVAQLQPKRTLPIQATAHRIGGLAIRQLLTKLHERDSSWAPRLFRAVTALRIEARKLFIPKNDTELVAHRHA